MQETILQVLRRNRGCATSADFQDAAGASQSTVSRALAPLVAAGAVLPVGAARRQVYLLPRQINGLGYDVSIFKVDGGGNAERIGRLIPIHGGRFWLEASREWGGGAHDSLPWFMQDMRPQGFLGRTFAKSHPELGLADNPAHWSEDDALRAICSGGEDLVGNLIVGGAALDRYLQCTHVMRDRSEFPLMAEQAILGGNPGSSAGGEQPKFCAFVEGRHVLVKFSPADDTPVAQRLRDLLIAEDVALRVLEEFDYQVAKGNAFMAGGRVFLEVERFDRTREGRVGLVSLMSYDAEFIGSIDNWAKTARRMRERSMLPPKDCHALQLLEAFGRLIANTDRHYGNISLIRTEGSWRLAPVYDFLPMLYIPVAGEIVQREFSPGDLAPTEEVLEVWPQAQEMAARYWTRLAEDDRLSNDFRLIAERHSEGMIRHVAANRPDGLRVADRA